MDIVWSDNGIHWIFQKTDWWFFLSVDLSSWEERIHADPDDEVNDIDESLPSEDKEGHEMYKGGVLTIGCVGKYLIFMFSVRHYHRYITSFS